MRLRLLAWAATALTAIALAGCVPTSFVRTGAPQPRLADDAPVDLLTARPAPGCYQEIGVVEVKGSNLEGRVEAARRVAREHGGDALVLLSSSTGFESTTTHQTVTTTTHDEHGRHVRTETTVPVPSVTSYEIQSFLVIRMNAAGP